MLLSSFVLFRVFRGQLKKIMDKTMSRIRRVVQIGFLLFFFFLFLSVRYPYEVAVPGDLFLRFSPLAPLFYFIDTLQLPSFFWPALLILILTPFLGRFFCGWICPLGTSLDMVSRVAKPPNNRKSRDWSKLRWVKFGILSAAIILALFSINIWGYFDPLAIFTRTVTVVLHPLFTFLSEKTLLAGAQIPALESAFYGVYDWYKTVIMPENQPRLMGVFSVLVLIGIIFGLEKLSRRFWCRSLCPAGALLGFLSQFRFYERIVGPECKECKMCSYECKMDAIPLTELRETNKVECIECFNCETKCPPKHQSITYRFRWKPYHSKYDFSRRQFLGTMAGGVVALGVFGVGFRHKNDAAALIRPPGALAEKEFLDRCIRCLECVRICESNGACLQPAGLELNLLNLWTPVAEMRGGYCEYNCNLCGEVCPTDAIVALSLEEKQKTFIGLAYFDKNLCIPYARNEDCLVCEEHCPLPEKAIKFDLREVETPEGALRQVKFPCVDRKLCIGCGICETKCPLPGKAGVFVIREETRQGNVSIYN
jgi:polyferredoxin